MCPPPNIVLSIVKHCSHVWWRCCWQSPPGTPPAGTQSCSRSWRWLGFTLYQFIYHQYDHSGHSGEAERVSLGVPGTQGQDDATAVQLPQIDCHRSFTMYFCVFEAENAILLKILFARRIWSPDTSQLVTLTIAANTCRRKCGAICPESGVSSHRKKLINIILIYIPMILW